MLVKVYEEIKKIIKDNYLFFSFYFILLAVLFYPLPYYIYSGGGLIDIDDKIKIEESTESKGNYNLCYVSEMRATLPTYLIAKLIPSWDWELVPIETLTLNEDETDDDMLERDRIFLNNGNSNAMKVAYEKAGKNITIKERNNYIIYIDENANTDLKIGDDIRRIENQEITSLDDISTIIQNKKAGDIIEIDIIRDNKEKTVNATLIEVEGRIIIGISFQINTEYETDPKITFSFNKNEAGSSGGLMMSLSIYDKLVDEDITRGRKIAGTGTIDENGNVGSIGGVKYKLSGAVKKKADIFLVPLGENYDECIEIQKKKKYDIEIIGVSTFDEALEKLTNN
ncbi:MAG: PDZ domain-containing protein [Firmicutes bacterium]|nr:PDZ domain-containing protein [Bacillota bacterium]